MVTQDLGTHKVWLCQFQVSRAWCTSFSSLGYACMRRGSPQSIVLALHRVWLQQFQVPTIWLHQAHAFRSTRVWLQQYQVLGCGYTRPRHSQGIFEPVSGFQVRYTSLWLCKSFSFQGMVTSTLVLTVHRVWLRQFQASRVRLNQIQTFISYIYTSFRFLGYGYTSFKSLGYGYTRLTPSYGTIIPVLGTLEIPDKTQGVPSTVTFVLFRQLLLFTKYVEGGLRSGE